MVIISPISSDEDDEIVCPPIFLGSLPTVINLKDGLETARNKGIKHFKHEHGLEFKEYIRNVQCMGCGHEMGGRGFSCMKHCYFHLHEICALFPEQITNYPHHDPQHLLTLKDPVDKVCSICGRHLQWELSYNCSICDFIVDLRCASIYLSFCGGRHQHELISNLCLTSSLCYLCGEKHGELGMFYECRSCSFLIHEQCYYFSDTIQHDCHEHPLHIRQSGRYINCDVCKEAMVRNFMSYNCDACPYSIHLKCFYMNRDRKVIEIPLEMEEEIVCPPNLGSLFTVFNLKDGLEKARDKGIKHFKHEHGLEFKEYVRDVLCRGCGIEMGGRGFSCMRHCDFHLHEICAIFPKEITNYPFHPQHPLTLDNAGHKFCDVCKRILLQFEGPCEFYYHCDICRFDIDVRCASLSLSFYGGNHKHKLVANLSPASFSCSFCGENHGELGISYKCKTCSFWIHEQCYYLPETIQHDFHKHPLHISLDKVYGTCGVCEENISDNFHKYYCGRCHYYIHVNCFHKKRDKKAIEIAPENEELIEFPMPSPHSVQSILTHFIKQKCGWQDMEDEKEHYLLLQHRSHAHPLALIDGPIEDGPDLEFDRPEFNNLNISDKLVNQSCNACTLLVLDASFYRCNESCNFILHKWCAELPREIQHPAHSGHTLVLHERVVFDFFNCRSCGKEGNGFAYKCRECEEYYLDVICASLPRLVKHENDEHPLILKDYREDFSYCNSCGPPRWREFCFCCDACHFRLDINCLLLPKEIRHRYDSHGFKLTDLVPACNEYYCVFCELKLNTKRWIYHCFECDMSAEVKCAKSRVFNLFRSPVKFGLSYSHLIGMTPWTCIPIFREENGRCCKCQSKVYYWDGFGLFCRESNKILCFPCYRELILSSQKALEESHGS